jgi:hypothetical protein
VEDSAVFIDEVIGIAVAVLCLAGFQVVLDDHLAAVCSHFACDFPQAIAAVVDGIDLTNGRWKRTGTTL